MTPTTLDRHAEAICREFEVTRRDVLGPSKARYLVEARRELLYRLAIVEGISTSVTGRLVGKRDHTTVLYNIGLAAQAKGWPPGTSVRALRAAEKIGRAA